jgi:hypothetical protein
MMRFAVQAETKDGTKYGVIQMQDGNFLPVRITMNAVPRPVMKGQKPAYKSGNPRDAFDALVRYLLKKESGNVTWARVPLNMAATSALVDYPMDRLHGLSVAARAEDKSN